MPSLRRPLGTIGVVHADNLGIVCVPCNRHPFTAPAMKPRT